MTRFAQPEYAWLLALASLTAATGCRISKDDTEPVVTSGTVVFLVLDGLRVDESLGDDPSTATGELPSEFMPQVWSELLPQGVRAPEAWSLGATTTTPAHVAILSGRRQPFANYPVGDDVGLYIPELPTAFDEVRAQLGGDPEQVALVANSDQVRPLVADLWPGTSEVAWSWVSFPNDEERPSQDDGKVIADLMQRMQATPTTFALANLHQIDRAGHYGDDDDYLEDARGLDSPVVAFWDWVQERPEYQDHTWLVVLSDHGRHSYSADDPFWRNHGCNCNGCRRVPLLVLGPGVAAGQDVGEPVLLSDLAPTMAARLGVRLPWADGLVRDDLFETASSIASRAGVADFATAGGLTAEVRYQDDPAHRSALWLAGQRVSDPDAIEVEAPALAADGDDAWACFREVVLTPDEADTAWRAHCLQSGDGGTTWSEMPAPTELVGPYWRPLLAPDGAGGLLGAWVSNLNGSSTAGVEGGDSEVTLDMGRYADGAWVLAPSDGNQTFPTDPVMATDGDHLLVAMGSGIQGDQARHTRDVYVARAIVSDGELAWRGVSATKLSELATTGTQWRLERPALRLDGLATDLAAIAYDEAGSHALLAHSADSGQSYQDARLVDLGHPLDPHVSPVWLGETAIWVTVDPVAESTWLCAVPAEGEVRCTATDAARIQRLQADGDTLWALEDRGEGSWELESWRESEL
ncbi:MAG: sulfatase-like hydrolase/transferase [Pseudomonadota bacterium]